MRRMSRAGQGVQPGGRLSRRRQIPGEALGEIAPLDKFKTEIGARRASFTPVFADFEKLDNMWMLQPRHRLGLGPEPQTLIAVGKVVAQQHLERHHSVKLGVPGTVDDAHTAPANLPKDLVIAHPRRGLGITGQGPGERARSIGLHFLIREAIERLHLALAMGTPLQVLADLHQLRIRQIA